MEHLIKRMNKMTVDDWSEYEQRLELLLRNIIHFDTAIRLIELCLALLHLQNDDVVLKDKAKILAKSVFVKVPKNLEKDMVSNALELSAFFQENRKDRIPRIVTICELLIWLDTEWQNHPERDLLVDSRSESLRDALSVQANKYKHMFDKTMLERIVKKAWEEYVPLPSSGDLPPSVALPNKVTSQQLLDIANQAVAIHNFTFTGLSYYLYYTIEGEEDMCDVDKRILALYTMQKV